MVEGQWNQKHSSFAWQACRPNLEDSTQWFLDVQAETLDGGACENHPTSSLFFEEAQGSSCQDEWERQDELFQEG